MNARSLTSAFVMIGLLLCSNQSAAYECDPSKGYFPDGVTCKPFPTEPNLSDEIRLALYADCMRPGYKDPYTQDCNGHLTDKLQRQLSVGPYYDQNAPTNNGGINFADFENAVKTISQIVGVASAF